MATTRNITDTLQQLRAADKKSAWREASALFNEFLYAFDEERNSLRKILFGFLQFQNEELEKHIEAFENTIIPFSVDDYLFYSFTDRLKLIPSDTEQLWALQNKDKGPFKNTFYDDMLELVRLHDHTKAPLVPSCASNTFSTVVPSKNAWYSAYLMLFRDNAFPLLHEINKHFQLAVSLDRKVELREFMHELNTLALEVRNLQVEIASIQSAVAPEMKQKVNEKRERLIQQANDLRAQACVLFDQGELRNDKNIIGGAVFTFIGVALIALGVVGLILTAPASLLIAGSAVIITAGVAVIGGGLGGFRFFDSFGREKPKAA